MGSVHIAAYFLLSCFLFAFWFLLFFYTTMGFLNIGSLNINGARDLGKRMLLAELIKQKSLQITFLQETHSDVRNEAEWGLWWQGEYRLSHGSNLSARVACLFSLGLGAKIISNTEPVPGRLLVVNASIRGQVFVFMNVYAPNGGADRLRFF